LEDQEEGRQLKKVQTVLGEISPEELGFTLPHEHVFHDIYEITLNSHMILCDPEVARFELGIFKEKGGGTIIDQTVHGLNPNPLALREVAEDVGINIVAGTGFYWERFHPTWLADMSETDMVRLMVSDLTQGFAGTDVKAGIIGEIGTNHRAISPAEERVIRACAAAQREVPVPIATHALFTRIGMDQARAFADAGADLDKVVIGHVDTTPDVDYHEELIGFGVWIAYDAIGQLDKQPDEGRADAIVELIRRGHRDRILLSTDVGKRGALRTYGGQGYDHVITGFLPLLRERGLTEADIEVLTVRNPQRLFTFEA
jgi:predicted metal-dependent phosphotriesterase family hydrolase